MSYPCPGPKRVVPNNKIKKRNICNVVFTCFYRSLHLEMLTEKTWEDSLTFFHYLAMDCHGLRAVSCLRPFWDGAVCRAQDAQLEQGQRLLRRMRYERKLLRYCQKKAGRMGREFIVLHLLITSFPTLHGKPYWFRSSGIELRMLLQNLCCDIVGRNAFFHRFRENVLLAGDTCDWHYRFLCQQSLMGCSLFQTTLEVGGSTWTQAKYSTSHSSLQDLKRTLVVASRPRQASMTLSKSSWDIAAPGSCHARPGKTMRYGDFHKWGYPQMDGL